MVLCDVVRQKADRPSCHILECIMTNIRSLEHPPFPLVQRPFCVYVQLTGARVPGTCQVRVVNVDAEPEEEVFSGKVRPVDFSSLSPLDVSAVSITIDACRFPRAGMYSVQFWYNGVVLESRPLRLR